MRRLSGFSRDMEMIPGNHSFMYSFICSSFIEPCYVKITELGRQIKYMTLVLKEDCEAVCELLHSPPVSPLCL